MLFGLHNYINKAQTFPAHDTNSNISPGYTEDFASVTNATDTGKVVSEEEPTHYKKPPRPLKTFDLYPNPANKIIYIRITGKQTVTLHNDEGKLIFRTAIREKATVNLSPLPAGNYILTDEKTGATKKFSIVR